MLNVPEEVKALLKSKNVQKNFRIHFPNGERDDITNSNLIKESVRFTESICSGDTLKFGLCEASVIEFETVGVENIKGMTIEAGVEICDDRLPDEYKNFYIPYGTFVVESCQKQSNMDRRKVIAYTNSINMDDFISVFENAKMQCRFSNSTAYTFNPAKFAIANISQSVNLDFDALGLFSGSGALKDELENASYYVIGNPFVPSTQDNFIVCVKAKSLNLRDYAASKYLIAYKIGSRIKSCQEIQDEYTKIIEKLEAEGSFEFSDSERSIKNYCMPFAKIENYNKKTGKYELKDFTGMNDSGFIDPEFNGYEVSSHEYLLFIPYEIEVLVAKSGITKEYTFEICNNTEIDADILTNEQSEIIIPDISATVNRIKNETGAYVVDKSALPSTTSLFKALLELNGRFLKQERGTGLYSLYSLKPACETIYVSDDLLIGEDLFPDNENGIVLDTKDYISAWYDDSYFQGYNAASVDYTDKNNEEQTLVVYGGLSTEGNASDDGEIKTLDLSYNYIIKNYKFDEESLQNLLSSALSNISGIKYMPVDIDLIGMPYVEAGDSASIFTENDEIINTIILRRYLKGIQGLQDNFESR